jgi:hypothetical protein
VRGDPAATIQKAQQIEQAALAPSDPSPQDRQVATEAAAMIQEAEAQLTGKKSGDSRNQRSVFA